MLRAHQLLYTGLLVALLYMGICSLPFPTEALSHPASASGSAGPYTVQGHTILDASGRPYTFHGVARDGLEFACLGDDYLTPDYLALPGPQIPGVNGTFWYGNTVRLPLSEAFWLYGQSRQHCTPASYQRLVRKTIDTLLLLHLNVIIDLQWTDAGGQSTGGAWQMPDEDSILFWRQMAKLYGGYPAVLFELYNEPHPYPSTGDPWGCWRSGCQVVNDDSNDFYCHCRLSLSYRAVGLQTLVDTLRQAGARNLVLAGGLNWGYDLSNLRLYALSGPNIIYDTHPYPYQGKQTPVDWEAAFGQISATYPVISAESGEYDCKASFMQRLIPYLDVHHIGWIGWAWYAQGSPCRFPRLVSAYDGTPEPGMGMYIYQALVRYAGGTPRTLFPAGAEPGSGPVSAQWYFPGEPVGEGFSQLLILDDASARDCTVTIQYILQPVRGPRAQIMTKTVALTIRALERITVQVNRDVGVPVASPGRLVAAIVRVTGSEMAGCAGIVAERAVHMDTGRLLGGSALPGFTRTGTTFFFADVPGEARTVVSALSIFNPGPQRAGVTVRYFAAGRQVGSQRDELLPLSGDQIRLPAGMPAHVAAVLVADQPVVAMRATLLNGLVVQGIGAISGLSEVPGVAQSAGDWFFAEGYAGPGFQEDLVVANPPGRGTAHLVITLWYASGEHRVFHASVLPGAQATWDVNVHTIGGGATPEVAAEVASEVPVVSERVMFFRYQLAGALTTGVTDMPGVVRAAASSVSAFADGYSAPGFAEWLCLQNITGQRELLTLTLVHAGQYVIYRYYLPPHGRGTISIDRLLQLSGQSSPQGYDVSLIVRSEGGVFVAERPMYWSVAGSRGGSDVVGYAGK